MARPIKRGLDSFLLDVDFFRSEAVVCISEEFGCKGESVLMRLLCAVYRNGYFVLWNDTLLHTLAHDVTGASPELISSVMHRALKWGIFDKPTFDRHSVLTSRAIQQHYFSAKRIRHPDPKLPYILIYQTTVDDASDEPPDNSLQEHNISYLKQFFSASNNVRLEGVLMGLHRENPATATINDFKQLAWEVVCEWEQRRDPIKADYKDWSAHLINHVRILNRKSKRHVTTNANKQYDSTAAKQERAEQFARHIEEKLQRGTVQNDVSDWY